MLLAAALAGPLWEPCRNPNVLQGYTPLTLDIKLLLLITSIVVVVVVVYITIVIIVIIIISMIIIIVNYH